MAELAEVIVAATVTYVADLRIMILGSVTPNTHSSRQKHGNHIRALYKEMQVKKHAQESRG